MTERSKFDYDLAEIELRARELRAEVVRSWWNSLTLRVSGLFASGTIGAKSQA